MHLDIEVYLQREYEDIYMDSLRVNVAFTNLLTFLMTLVSMISKENCQSEQITFRCYVKPFLIWKLWSKV